MEDFLQQTFFQNTVLDYLISLGFILLGLLLVKAFRKIVVVRLRRLTENTDTQIDNYVVDSIDKYGVPAIMVAVIYVGISYLILSARVDKIIQNATTVAITILVIRFLSTVILLLLKSYLKNQNGEDGEEKIKQLGGLMLLINVMIWIVGFLFLFDNMGYDVTAVIAGLGIGGIAVALAAQNILGDLFNYFVIFLDRPFEVGDFIIIDDKLGSVEHIGIKTTRLKSLSGEQLVFSNSDLTNSRIHNYKRMQRRRVLFKLGVIYQTSFDKIKQIPKVLKEVIKEQDLVEFDRAHFSSYGDSSLNFEIVYFVLSSDYNVFMDIQERINFRIYEEFEKLDVDFAFPTRTIFIANQDEIEKEASFS